MIVRGVFISFLLWFFYCCWCYFFKQPSPFSSNLNCIIIHASVSLPSSGYGRLSRGLLLLGTSAFILHKQSPSNSDSILTCEHCWKESKGHRGSNLFWSTLFPGCVFVCLTEQQSMCLKLPMRHRTRTKMFFEGQVLHCVASHFQFHV